MCICLPSSFLGALGMSIESPQCCFLVWSIGNVFSFMWVVYNVVSLCFCVVCVVVVCKLCVLKSFHLLYPTALGNVSAFEFLGSCSLYVLFLLFSPVSLRPCFSCTCAFVPRLVFSLTMSWIATAFRGCRSCTRRGDFLSFFRTQNHLEQYNKFDSLCIFASIFVLRTWQTSSKISEGMGMFFMTHGVCSMVGRKKYGVK